MLTDYHSEILEWAAESIDWMSRADSLTFFDPEKLPDGVFFDRRAECIWRLSALLDRGRLFFPNEATEKVGLHKPQARRGLRPIVLDQLKHAHNYVRDLRSSAPNAKPPMELHAAIVDCKRQFVFEVQRVVEPEERQRRLKEILSSSSAAA
jgi:hypothetical protein